MADDDLGWDAPIPEKKTMEFSVMNKFLLDLVSGGSVAAIAETATIPIGGSLASVARFAPSLGLSLAFKEQYKNIFLEGVDKNDRARFMGGNMLSGAAAGATALCFVHPTQTFFARLAAQRDVVRTVRMRATSRETALGCLLSTFNSLNMFKAFFSSLPGNTFHGAFYFGLYDTMKVEGASGDQKLNFFSSFSLAVATTSLSYPFFIAGTINPDHVTFFLNHESSNNKVLSFVKNTVGYVVHQTQNFGLRQFAIRSVTGALVLASYDEIQKWLH
ncbi:hypothetical protein PMAYCL1PPCAC_20605 [Pristionchus mayeri]|uniref:ADP/ATP translocase n=1 Tax=Pristionchus mayeri TaxID=1317129 RepID=A0AAN5CU23_9BILA|nr:hypothetical protein PMAYCL1PPCAC_20605 [Pristionchus mayeri]